ncbi:hypothetical protein [uncultured Veillonella sp.]|uniref:hypothetical protein n=1 Tax=uncultured Veillonella sp. TaxID=159268 RepID=UPI00262F8BE6|nr:hypothetical protein [uncultured Veillonella sp.]
MKFLTHVKKSVVSAMVLGLVAVPVMAGVAGANSVAQAAAPVDMKPAADGTYSREQLEYLAKLIQDRFNKNLPAINKKLNDQLQKNNQEEAQKALGNRKMPIVLTNKANLPASYTKEHIKANFTDVSSYVQKTGFVKRDLKTYVQPISEDDGLVILTSYAFRDNKKESDGMARYIAYDLNTDKIYYAKYRLNYNTKTLRTNKVDRFDYVEVADAPDLHDEMENLAAQVGYHK